MNAGGLAQMASFNNLSVSNEFGMPTSGFTSRRGSTIKSLSFDQSKLSSMPENTTPTPRTSRSHLLAGLRTAPKTSRSPGPLTAPPYLLHHNSGNNTRYTTENTSQCGPRSSTFMDQNNICGTQVCGSQIYTMPEDILAPPEIHIDESGCDQMDANYYAQLVATNRYLAEQQQRLQQQLLNVQAAAQQFQGLNLGIQQCSTPPITPQSLYQQQLKYNLQNSSPLSTPLPMYSCYNTISAPPAYIPLDHHAAQYESVQNSQHLGSYPSIQRTTAPTRTRTIMMPSESTIMSRSASPPVKPQSPAIDHAPLPPPSAGAFRRGHRKTPSSLAVGSDHGGLYDGPKTSSHSKPSGNSSLCMSGFGPGQGRIGEHPIRQPFGPPSMDVLISKPTTKFEGAKNFATRTRRSAVDNLVRAVIERRRAPGSTGSGSISPASDGGEVAFSMTDNDSDSGRSGGGSLPSRPALGSPRTSIHGAIGSNRPSSRQNSRFLERKSVASLDSSYTSTSMSGDESNSLGGKFAAVIKNGRRHYESDDFEKKAPMLVLTPAEKRKNFC